MGRILINERGNLSICFELAGKTYEEPTAYPANEENIGRARRLLARIDADVRSGAFDYGLLFPSSKHAVQLAGESAGAAPSATPSVAEFAQRWYDQLSVGWKPSNRESIRYVINGAIVPHLGDRPVDSVRRAELLEFRAEIMRTRPGRNGNKTIGNRRANRIMTILQGILREAALQWGYPDPTIGMKPLKEPRTDIQPFTLEEVGRLVASAPPIYQDYVLVRCLTGLRSGEINGLRWDQVDFVAREFRVREARVRGEQVLPKSEYSNRDIPMSKPVVEAFKRQFERTGGANSYVFVTKRGCPINTNNFSNRDWPKILTIAKLKQRRPYQTRHTAATLMLASGENPEWIAHVLGHSDCEMLWRVYSRYVPNMTRKDGSALDAVVQDAF